ncbi:ACP S-malonyltransferase [Streptomyces sp. NPDC007172]|uniref:ACP S-malonyltransferase n=1 Tax=Streptomyces sp. NPDC007172 TaxID=3364776 RepID=UPI00369A82DB
MGEVLEEVDQVAARRGLPLLAPWLLGTAPPSGRDLAEAPVGTAQLALFGASVTIHRALSERLGPPDAVVGVSFGEIAALTAAGVFDIAQGAAIAWELGRILTSSCPGGLALLGCGESAACSIASQADSRDVVVACVNDPQESVVSGPSDQLALVEKRAAGLGIAAVRLRLPFSSHHPALGRQAKEFAQVVRRYPVRRMTCVVLSAVARRPYVPDDDLAARLADCLMRPAHVPDAIALAAGHTLPGQRLHLFEAGTGSALATNARRILAGQPATVHAPLADPGFSW